MLQNRKYIITRRPIGISPRSIILLISLEIKTEIDFGFEHVVFSVLALSNIKYSPSMVLYFRDAISFGFMH